MGVRIRPQTEAEFTRIVLERAWLGGWRSLHVRPARTKNGWRTPIQGNGKGFPDVLLIRGTSQIVAELKMPGNELTAEQEEWLKAFAGCGVPAYIWFPSDWDEIESVLT